MLGQTRRRALLFDFDGTLVDTAEAICRTFRQVLISHGVSPMEDHEIRTLIGQPLRDMLTLATGLNDKKEIEKLASDYRRIASRVDGDCVKLFPGVEAFLAALSSDVQKGIVTSRSHAGTRSILRSFGLESQFQTVVGIDDVIRPKPHPEPVFQALDMLGTDPEMGVMVGDTVSDMMAGASAGVRTIGITNGSHTREELLDAGAEAVVSSFSELVTLLGGFQVGPAELSLIR